MSSDSIHKIRDRCVCVFEKEKEKKKKKEEEMEAKALPNRDCDHSLHCLFVLCSSCNSQLVLFLRVECKLCTLRGPLCYYEHYL